MPIEQALDQLTVLTAGEGFTNLTSEVQHWIKKQGIKRGVVHLTVLHTSCSLIINENADPKVLSDLSSYMNSIVPQEGIRTTQQNSIFSPYQHSSEGPDDMPAHIRTSLTSTNLSISIDLGKLVLGTWQGVYLWEHRDGQHSRSINLHVFGEK